MQKRSFFHTLGSPAAWLALGIKCKPLLSVASILLFIAGSIVGLFYSPADYQQGEAVRMMYVHVPAAWMALLAFTMMWVASISYIIWKNPLCALFTLAAAPIGAAFAMICLVTGSIWGKPMWGTWWVWDARLTSMLILWFFYLGILAVSHTMEQQQERRYYFASLLAILGGLNVPIVKFSVDWWYTLHQPASLFRKGGAAIDGSMLLPLLLMAGAYFCFFIAVLVQNLQAEIFEQRLRRSLFSGDTRP